MGRGGVTPCCECNKVRTVGKRDDHACRRGVSSAQGRRGGIGARAGQGRAGMARAAGKDWDKLERFDTHRLLEAVDELDTLRGLLADDGTKPPEIRDRLLRLHQLAMAVVNEGDRDEAGEMFELAQELGDEVFDMLEAAQRLHETLVALAELRPEDLDDGEGDDD